MGEQADGKDSIARQVAPEWHWPQLRVLILVVSILVGTRLVRDGWGLEWKDRGYADFTRILGQQGLETAQGCWWQAVRSGVTPVRQGCAPFP